MFGRQADVRLRLSDSAPATEALKERLDAALRRIVVCAWRLHLETPGVQATVPMLRGVWGAALKTVSEPLYQEYFVGGASGTPRYVMRPAPPDARPAPAIEFLLFRPPEQQADEAIWAAWELACRGGLGPHRYPFVIREVCPLACDESVKGDSPIFADPFPGYPAKIGTVPIDRSHPGFALSPLSWPGDDIAAACRLTFPAPLRLIYRGRLIERPTLADVTIAALRRVRALAATAADAVWLDRQSWLDLVRQIACQSWQGERLDLVRYSASQQRELELRGVAGSLLLPEGPGPLAPLLAASTWLHLGKGTVIGLGQLRVNWQEHCPDAPQQLLS